MSKTAEQVAIQEIQDPPPQPVDVDIDNNTVVEAPVEQKTTEEQPRPKPKPRHEARIQTLVSEREEARSYAAQLQQELERSRREAAEAKAAKDQAERAGMTNYAARVDADVEAARAALKAAKEAKDDDAEIVALSKLSRAEAAAADVDAWRATQPKDGERQEPEPRPQQQPQQQAPQYVTPPEPVRNFMVENSWFSAIELDDNGNPRKTQDGRFVANPNFDEDMHEEAMTEHRRIQRDIRLGRVSKDFINSPEYFERISARVAQVFPDAFESEEEEQPQQQPKPRTPPMSPSRQPVAPAQRQSQPGAPPKNGDSKMRLDGEQADFVRRLVDNGTMIYPRNHPDATKRGQKMSYNDAYVQYAKNLKSDPGSQQNR